MKTKLLTLLIVCVALSSFAVFAGAASFDRYVPKEMAQAINEILPLVIKELGIDDQSVIDQASKYLSVSYTEQQSGQLYYNNSDWKVELSFFFPDGEASIDKAADSVNFILSNDLNELQQAALLYTFGIALAYQNPDMDQDKIIDYLTGPQDVSNVLETAIGNISFYPNEQACQVFMFKPEIKEKIEEKPTLIDPSQIKLGTGTKKKDDQALFDSNGITIKILQIRPSLSKNFIATLRLDLHLVNKSGHKIDIKVDNAKVNGVAVKGIGDYNLENGLDSETEFFLLKAETDAAIREICNSREATFDIIVTDDKTYEEIARKSVSLSLSSVPSFTPYPTEAVTATPKPTVKPTPKPTAKPTSKPSSISSGSNKSFYGITSMSFSDRVWASWDKKPGDMLNIRFEVLAKTRQVKSFVLYLYAVDDWGDRIYGNQIYSWTTRRQIARGVTAYSDYVLIPERSKIKTVYCGIKRVSYTEGPDEEVPDDEVNYYHWDLR